MAVVLYGIKNCDTIKKARRWLDANHVTYTFHDYRQDGLDSTQLLNFEKHLGWEALLNKRGTTWRNVSDDIKTTINKESALKLMEESPAMIKRPILDLDGRLILGFSDQSYQQQLS